MIDGQVNKVICEITKDNQSAIQELIDNGLVEIKALGGKKVELVPTIKGLELSKKLIDEEN